MYDIQTENFENSKLQNADMRMQTIQLYHIFFK